MHAKLAIVGAAALGAQAAVAACPLNVEISNVNGHQVDVTVTNTGSEDLSVFKGDTVLSEHHTQNVQVANEAGETVPFTGLYVLYDRRNLHQDLIETIPAGATVTKTVNVAATHELAGVNSIQVAAVQEFNYQPASSDNLNTDNMSVCSSQSADVQVTPDQATAKRDHISSGTAFGSRIEKRAITYSGCSSSQTSTIQTGFSRAVTQSKNAVTAAASSADYYTTWFKSSSVLSTVQSIYNSVSGVQSTSLKFYCNDFGGACSGGTIAYTQPSTKQMAVCPSGGFWSFPLESPDCTDVDYDQAGTLLHESTHLYGTTDYAYGESACKALSASQASKNADTYEIYAGSVRLGGCS